jgi:hypothetical protein
MKTVMKFVIWRYNTNKTAMNSAHIVWQYKIPYGSNDIQFNYYHSHYSANSELNWTK